MTDLTAPSYSTYRTGSVRFTVRDGKSHSLVWRAINQEYDRRRRERLSRGLTSIALRRPRWL